MKNKIFLFMFVFLFLYLQNTSAMGLRVNETMINVNKTAGQDISFNFNLVNDENFSFYNITFISTDISFPNISEIPARQMAVVTGTIKKDLIDVNSILIKGLYYSNLGQQYKTYYINVTTTEPKISQCDLNLVVGDTIVWYNKVLDPIVMKDNNGIPVEGGTILPNNTFTKQFLQESVLNYHFDRSSFTFTPNCIISTVNATGLVNNALYDAVLDINVRLKYEDTTLSNNILTSNYTSSFDSSQEGIMIVTNTGNKTAYNVQLNGDWLTFNLNGFSLSPGQTKAIVYTITPVIIETNQTGKTYYKQLTITGNFPTINNTLSIYINQANIGTGNNTDADYLIRVFCPRYPNSTLCNPEPRVVYRYIDNSSNKLINVTITKQQFDDLWAYMFATSDEQRIGMKDVKDLVYNVMQTQNISTTDLTLLKDKFQEDKEAREKTLTNVLIFVGIGFTLLAVTIGGALIYLNTKRKALESQRRF